MKANYFSLPTILSDCQPGWHLTCWHTPHISAQLSIVMGVNYPHLSVQQIFVFLLLSIDLKKALNSDLVLSDVVDNCEAPWRSLGSTSSCYVRGEDIECRCAGWNGQQISCDCQQISWEEAQTSCIENGGYLVEIGSEEEQALLTGNKFLLAEDNSQTCTFLKGRG